MIEIIAIVIAIILFILGIIIGKQQNKGIITELKKDNKELKDKFDKLEEQNVEQKEMLEKSIQAVGALNKQNDTLINKIGSLESQVSRRVPTPTVQEKGSEINKLLGELGIYLAKEYGKKKIDEWLYPDD